MTNAIPAQPDTTAPEVAASPSTSGRGEFLIKPRRQIGPDAITMLRHTARCVHDNKFGFDGYRVQRNEFGKPNAEIDFGNMEYIGGYHKDCYGTLIHDVVIPKAKVYAQRLEGADPSLIHYTLSTLLNASRTSDSTNWWILSTVELRSLLFPHAYDENKRRTDRVLYLDRPYDKGNRGKACYLSSLQRGGNKRFVQYASSLIGQPFDAKTITPLQLERATA